MILSILNVIINLLTLSDQCASKSATECSIRTSLQKSLTLMYVNILFRIQSTIAEHFRGTCGLYEPLDEFYLCLMI